MAIVNDGKKRRIGRGKLFIRVYDGSDDGDQGSGFAFQHQITSALYTPNINQIEETDCTSGVGGTLEAVVTSQKPTLKLTSENWEAQAIANALMGKRTVGTQAATPVVAEPHANVLEDGIVVLNKRGPATSIVVKNEGGTVTYVIDDDYTVEDNGFYVLIKIVAGGAITTGDTIEVGYTPTAYTAIEEVSPGSETSITAELMFVGTEAYGPNYNFRVWKASIKVDGDREFIQAGDEFGKYDITFTLIDDSANHVGFPFMLLERVDNAA
ncbi:MAG TPA: hypothetical protein VN903_29210 [Polyangia bacterium]|nr:hypothetical protein [Polyangia bacterium]